MVPFRWKQLFCTVTCGAVVGVHWSFSYEPNPRTKSALSDRRTQTRIQVNIPIKVTFSRMAEPMNAVNQDISWGGVLFVISDPPPQETGSLRIVLPWKQNEKITADAHLVRVKRLQNGSYLIAARFYSLSPRSHARLERLIKNALWRPIRTY